MVRIQLMVRKFMRRHPTCERCIFTECLPDLVAAYAQKACQLVAGLQAIGMTLGGEAILARRGGAPLPESTDEVRRARQERADALAGLRGH